MIRNIRFNAKLRLLPLVLFFSFVASSLFAEPWWKHAVIYEIYPRSFQDSDGNGVGDLNGITSRLDYLKELGIDAVWITPMFPSPQIDFGYDIADFTSIDPQYGTMADFDRLVAEAKKRQIRVIMDLVANHTSDQHTWFKESRSSKNNPKRDWYVWRNGKAPNKPPNNWMAWFGGSAWKLDPKTGQHYYHYFYTEQPDLNWRNPEVKKAMFDVMRFWLDRGAAGYRIDAISRLFEDPNFRDESFLPGTDAYGNPKIDHKYTDNLPEVHDVLREMRKLVDSYPGKPVLISEADQPNITELTKMYGNNNDEVQLPMDFQFALVNRLSAPQFRKLIDEVDRNTAGGQPYFFFSNHDQPRQWDRYGDGKNNDQIAKITATLLLATRATPQLYYGEEIGMVTTPPTRKEDVQDPVGRTAWPKDKGRDGERTPMQWDATRNAGFSTAAKTWLPVPPSFKQRNVATESKDPNSILNFYKELIALRRSEAAFRGSYVALNTQDQNVLSWLRKNTANGNSFLVALNMSNAPQKISFDLKKHGIAGISAQPVLTSPVQGSAKVTLQQMSLKPYAVFIGAVR